MEFSDLLVPGKLIKRYKRFLADVQLDSGEIITAHCPNTGSMTSCCEKDAKVYLLYNPSKKRKLSYTWELTETEGGYIGINTMRPNQLVEEALKNKIINQFNDYPHIKREIKVNDKSKLDFRLQSDNESLPDIYIEVKNVTLKENNLLQFPDSVSERGTKHLRELIQLKKEGHRAILLFVINRPEPLDFKIAEHIDSKYFETFLLAKKEGVEFLTYKVKSNPREIQLTPFSTDLLT